MSSTAVDEVKPARPGLPMDPRMRQRRIAVRRDEGRKRLRILAALVTVAGLAGGVVAATHSALLDVDHVRIAGIVNTSEDDVLRAAGLDRHRFMVDVGDGMAQRVRALPWVAKVSVERSWPGTVRLQVVERTPLAIVPAAGGVSAIVDQSGRVLASQQIPGLPRIDGVAPAPEPGAVMGADAKAALAVAAALPEDVRGRVATISQGPEGLELQLRDKGGPLVRFGSDDALGPKIVALTTMLTKLDLTNAAEIDVRVPAAPVLTRRGAGR